MTELNAVRFAWLKMPIHERIMMLEEASKADVKNEHIWIKKIPHEMCKFNEFFSRYTPQEMVQIKANSVNGKKYTPTFNVTSGYFVFNPETNIVTSVEDIDGHLRDLFDSLLSHIGAEKMIEVFEHVKEGKSWTPSDYIIGEELQKEINEMYEPGKMVIVKMRKNTNGEIVLYPLSKQF